MDINFIPGINGHIARCSSSGNMEHSLNLYKWSKLTLLKATFNAEHFLRRLSWSISNHFGAVHSWNVCRSLKWRKIH